MVFTRHAPRIRWQKPTPHGHKPGSGARVSISHYSSDTMGQIPKKVLTQSWENTVFTTGALAANQLISSPGPVLAADYRVIKFTGAILWDNQTNDQGPLCVVLVDAVMTDAEVADAMTQRPRAGNDVPAVEKIQRRVHVLGYVEGSDEHKMIHFETVIGQTFLHDPASTNSGWKIGVFNTDNTVITTGGTIHITGKIQGMWL